MRRTRGHAAMGSISSNGWAAPSYEVGMPETRRAQLIAFGVAILTPALTLLLRLVLWPVLGDAVPFMGFFPAVIIVAYFGGLWPGILAVLLSTFAAYYFILEPRYSFTIP